MQDYSATTLVQAALQASQGEKGMASGILNALLGSCCYRNDKYDAEENDAEGGARQACALMRAYDKLGDVLKPDLVALSLAHVACSQHASFRKQSNLFLKRAETFYGTTATRNSSAVTGCR